MLDEKDKEEVKMMIRKQIEDEQNLLHQSQFPAGVVKRRALADKITVFGLAANRPVGDSTGISVWFATDTDVLSCYNGTAWVEETLT